MHIPDIRKKPRSMAPPPPKPPPCRIIREGIPKWAANTLFYGYFIAFSSIAILLLLQAVRDG